MGCDDVRYVDDERACGRMWAAVRRSRQSGERPQPHDAQTAGDRRARASRARIRVRRADLLNLLTLSPSRE